MTLPCDAKTHFLRLAPIMHSMIGGFITLMLMLMLMLSMIMTQQVYAQYQLGTADTQIHASAQDAFLRWSNPRCDIQLTHVQAAKLSSSGPATTQKLDWVDVTLPDRWEKRWPGYSGTVRYQLLWQQHCPSQLDSSLAIGIDRINMAGTVFLNGQKIWQDQRLVEPISRSWNTARHWIQAQNNFIEGENKLVIDVVGVATQSPGLGDVYIGTAAEIIQHQSWHRFVTRTLYLVNLIVSITLGVIGFLIWMFRRQDSTFGWFALASIIWAIFISNILATTTFPFQSTLQLARFNMSCLVLYAPCFAIYTMRFAGRRYARTEYLMWLLSLVLIISIIFTPITDLQLALSLAFLFAIFIFISTCISYQWIAYRSKRVDVYVLAVLLLGFLIIAIHDVLKILTNTPGNFTGTPFAAPLMTIAISLIFAWRIADNINKIEFFNERLEIKIVEVKAELEHSLDKKHQLEIENTRLQERLNLSHDLHDGLGGSLVRSIALVDRSEELDKQHFMSILKLLRNDLRQIIDSGSSIGAKVPETPILWGAPLRHRYIQLFDEMDIDSVWQFEAHWHVLPTALEALTMARVTEEALTNIIKHSQATRVTVRLSQDENAKFRLSIEDNGVGFNPDTVQQGLHVGLHSMQIRVARIGAKIEIHSEAGCTRIEVLIPLSSPPNAL